MKRDYITIVGFVLVHAIYVITATDLESDVAGYLGVANLLLIFKMLVIQSPKDVSFKESLRLSFSFKGNNAIYEKLAILSILAMVPFGSSLKLSTYLLAIVFLLRGAYIVLDVSLSRLKNRGLRQGVFVGIILLVQIIKRGTEGQTSAYVSSMILEHSNLLTLILLALAMLLTLKSIDYLAHRFQSGSIENDRL